MSLDKKLVDSEDEDVLNLEKKDDETWTEADIAEFNKLMAREIAQDDDRILRERDEDKSKEAKADDDYVFTEEDNRLLQKVVDDAEKEAKIKQAEDLRLREIVQDEMRLMMQYNPMIVPWFVRTIPSSENIYKATPKK